MRSGPNIMDIESVGSEDVYKQKGIHDQRHFRVTIKELQWTCENNHICRG